jgi:YD repeat-containing protein
MSSSRVPAILGALVSSFFLAIPYLAYSQVATGTPSFSAYDSHSGDTVNLQNLNVIVNVPVRSKAGAIPFDYGYVINSYMYPSTVTPQWFAGTDQLNGGIAEQAVWVSYSTSNTTLCPDGIHNTTEYKNWFVYTADNTFHYLPATDFTDLRTDGSGLSCYSTTFTDQVVDATGYTLKATQSSVTSVYDRSGNSILTSGTTAVKDPHGNKISYNSSSHTWTDSLGVTVVTTSAGVLGAWTDVNGGSPQVSFSTTAEHFKTVFGCSGINDSDIANYGFVTGISYPDGTSLAMGFEGTPGNTGDVTGRIGTLTLRAGGTVTYGYSGSNNGINCTYQVPPTMTRQTSDGTTTYTWAAVNNGSGNWGNTTTVTDQGGNNTVYTFTGLTSTGNAAFPVVQALTRVQHYQGSSTLLTTDVYCYNANASNCATAAVSLPVTEVDVYHTVNGMSNSSRTQKTFDAYGNVLTSAQYDFGGTSPVRKSVITYYQVGTTCGALSSGSNINDKPCEVQTSQNGSVIADVKYNFDQYGNLTKTSVWNGSSWIGQSSSNTYNANGTPLKTFDLANNETDYTYASGGYSDGCGSTPNYLFATSVKDVGTGLTVSATYDCMGGVKLTNADANGNATGYCYNSGTSCSGGTADPYWRMLQTIDPYTATMTYTYPTGSSPDTIGYSFKFSSSIEATTLTTDGYGRAINSQTAQSPSGSNYDTTSTSYGWLGNYFTVSTSQPCSALSGSCTTVHAKEYDPLDRPHIESTTSNEALTFTYSVTGSYATDLGVLTPAPAGENSKQSELYYNGLGWLMNICHIGSTASTGSGTVCSTWPTVDGALDAYTYTQGTGYTESYVTRSGTQQRTNYYDAMGRLYQKSTPEGGTWNYTYDTPCSSSYLNTAGRLAKTVDPNLNTICYSYDSLGRVTLVNANGTTCRHFYYDNTTGYSGTLPTGVSLTNPLGNLSEAATDTCSSGTLITDEWFARDKDNRVLNYWQLTPHSTQYYQSTATYYENGAINTIQLASPSLYTLTYGLDGEGRWDTLEDGSTMMVTGPSGVYPNSMYDPAGHVLNVQLTGTTPDQDIYTYDSNTGRMKTFEFEVGNTPANLTGTLTWNANGTLANVAVVDGFNSGGSSTCYSDSNSWLGYGYDDWGRLLAFDCGSGNVAEYMQPDQYDNVTMSVPTGISRTGWTFSPGYNASNNRVTGNTYDSNGNTTADGGSNTYGYNEFSKVKWTATSGTPTCGTSGKCVTYDAFGRMVETSNGTAWVELWYPQVPGARVTMSGASQKFSYWPSPGRGIYLESSTKQFLHLDWLGNDRIVSAFSGHTVSADRDYTPYGQQFNTFGSSNPQFGIFAGMSSDYDSGTLFDTPNREFAVNQLRWTSPDPAGSGWNQYAYPTNPNSFIDPSGLCGGLSKLGNQQVDFSCSGGGNPYSPSPDDGDYAAGAASGAAIEAEVDAEAGQTVITPDWTVSSIGGTLIDPASQGTLSPNGTSQLSGFWGETYQYAQGYEGAIWTLLSDLLGSFKPVNPVLCGPGIPCSVVQTYLGRAPLNIPLFLFKYTVVDSNGAPVAGVTLVQEYMQLVYGNLPENISYWTSDPDDPSGGALVNGSFIDGVGPGTILFGSENIQTFSAQLGGINYLLTTQVQQQTTWFNNNPIGTAIVMRP